MENKEEKEVLVGKVAIIVDIIICAAVFVIMSLILRPFVPMQGEGVVEFWAAFTALPIALMFWIVLQMFRVTLSQQIQLKKEKQNA